MVTLIAVVILMQTHLALAGQWQITARGWEHSEQQVPDSVVERHAYSANYYWDEPNTVRKLNYEHHAILVHTGAPASNGYFHRLDVTGSHQQGSLQISATLGVHGSSNMFQKFEFHKDAMVGSYKVRYPLWRTHAGVNGDYRFDNRFRNYPVIASTWNFANGSELIIELPVHVGWQSADSLWQLNLERCGEKWATLHSETHTESATYFNEWRLQGRARVLKGATYSLYLLTGWSFDSEIRYLDLIEGQVNSELAESLFFGFEASF